jgi:hypothetical protein
LRSSRFDPELDSMLLRDAFRFFFMEKIVEILLFYEITVRPLVLSPLLSCNEDFLCVTVRFFYISMTLLREGLVSSTEQAVLLKLS